MQTAVLASQALDVLPKAKKSLLTMSPEDGEGLIEDGKAVLIVGHGPELVELVKSLTGRTVFVRFDAISSSFSSMLSDSRSSVSSSISPSSSSSSSSSTDRTSGEASASLSCITASPSSPSVLLLKARYKELCM